jgi:hypothetical protein
MRTTHAGAMLAFVSGPGTDRITLELEPGEPIHGRLLDATGAAKAFRGWLELCDALERARRHPIAAAEDTLVEMGNSQSKNPKVATDQCANVSSF